MEPALSAMQPFTLNQRRAAICVALALGTLALYWPLTHYDFTNIDDPRFVTQNPHVQAGLTWQGFLWAFKSVYTEAWQPVTWLSHMLDCQIYGLKAGGHHLTNILFHVANTVLLFLCLEKLTGATGRSAFVAALFACHPLHVEPVAWVCERKELLSAFFWLLGTMVYIRYARKPGAGTYLVILALYALGLMSKPSIITLPCVFLLLDFWPLNRFKLLPETDGGAVPVWRLTDKAFVQRAARLVAEKIPFFILAVGISRAAIYAQKAGGSLGSSPLPLRVENALAGYFAYLSTTFWPTGLAYFYPFNPHIPLTTVIGSASLLAVCTVWLVMRVRQQPYLLVGWFWFVGVLVPTIGLVQFCIQARADRYTYLPSIGLFLTLTWGASDLVARRPAWRKFLPLAGGLAIAGCLTVSSVQVRYWRNSVTIARHAIEVTENNYVAYESLGRALYERGLKQQAIECYNESIRIFPGFPESQYNLGVALLDAGRINEAVEHFETVVKMVPGDFDSRMQLGSALLAAGNDRLAEAADQFSTAVRLNPRSADTRVELAVTLARQGKLDDALPQFAEAVRLAPANAEYKFNYGFALLNSHQPAEAATQFADEAKLTPGETKAHYRLAQALEQAGLFTDAVREYREALRLTPDFPEAKAALDKILAAHPELK
jgi:protein O-mannosyl-transferase